MEPTPTDHHSYSYTNVRATNSFQCSSAFKCRLILIHFLFSIWFEILILFFLNFFKSHPASIAMFTLVIHWHAKLFHIIIKKVLHLNCSGRFNEMQLIFCSVSVVHAMCGFAFSITNSSQWHCTNVWYRFVFGNDSIQLPVHVVPLFDSAQQCLLLY